MLKCFSCDGSGLEPGHTRSTCPICLGDKKLISMQIFTKTIMTCLACHGDGLVIMPEDFCIVCSGRGKVAPAKIELLLEEAGALAPASSKFVDAVNAVKNIKAPKMKIPKWKNPFKKKETENDKT